MLKDFGADLKALRESRNISIAEVASETRINPKFILNMEAGIFDFQPDTYIRAFLKEYGEILGIEESEILGDFERARSGVYTRKHYLPYEEPIIREETPVIKEEKFPEPPPVNKPVENVKKEISASETKEIKPYIRKASYEESEVSPNRALYQKIVLGIIVVGVLVGLYFLYDYLAGTGGNSSADVQPKSFDEISGDFENKLNRRGDKELEDSLARLKASQLPEPDSLTLTIRARSRDVTIRIFIDDNNAVTEGIIAAGDTVQVKAKKDFRFSSKPASATELYLNFNKLTIPPTTDETIKNLPITKDGVVAQ